MGKSKIKPMKKSISVIIFAVIFMITPVLSFGQKTDNTKEEKKISYSFINEYGFYAGGTLGFTGVFVNGIRFNKTQDLIGIGIGYESDTRWSGKTNIPIFLNYRHYFSGKKALKPLINVGIGTRLSFLYLPPYYMYNTVLPYPYYDEQRIPGLYATFATGFKVKALSFTSGVFVKSCDKDFFGGVEVKVGFTF